MKTIFLLLGVGCFSLQGFAGSSKGDTKSGDKSGGVFKAVLNTAKNLKPGHKVKTQWLSRLNDESNWRGRVGAVKDWKTVFHYAPEEIFAQLELRLSDKSQKVREAVVTASEEMATESGYSKYKKKIVKALAERRPNDTENLFLRKMETAMEIFKNTSLYTVSEDGRGSHAVFEELEVSGIDQVLVALYEMAETGLSAQQNFPARQAAIQLLDVILDRLIKIGRYDGLFATSKAKDQVFDYSLQGIQIAVTGLADKNPEVHSATKDLLGKTFQSRSLSDTQASQVIPEVAKVGFSHSNHKVRTEIIDWLLEIAELYPSLKSEIASIVKARQAKESSLRMKVAIKKAVRKLSNSKTCKENWRG